jgi:hypothetical protein
MHNRRLNLLQWKIPGDASFEFAAIYRNAELTNELQTAGLMPRDPRVAAARDEYPYDGRPGAAD